MHKDCKVPLQARTAVDLLAKAPHRVIFAIGVCIAVALAHGAIVLSASAWVGMAAMVGLINAQGLLLSRYTQNVEDLQEEEKRNHVAQHPACTVIALNDVLQTVPSALAGNK